MTSSQQECDAAWAKWEAEQQGSSSNVSCSNVSCPPAGREAALQAYKEKSDNQALAGCAGIIAVMALSGWGCMTITGGGILAAILGGIAAAAITSWSVPRAWKKTMSLWRGPEQSPVHVVSAAREDARAQDEMEAMVQETIAFLCDVVEKARACDEVLARGYYVTREGSHKALYHYSSCTGWESRKVAVADESGVFLEETEHCSDGFINDLNSGLLDEIGRFLIQRSQRSRQRADAMNQAVQDPAVLRHILNEENWL